MHEPSDRRLAEAIREAAGEGVEIAPEPENLDDVLAAIGGCDALVGMRLHALLLAANRGIPVVAWSYDPKVDALMHRIGSPDGLLPLEISPEAAAGEALRASWRRVDTSRTESLRRDALRTLELLADMVRK
jgi:polysaccharide pyruvyl transferase WcaK-like protein